MERFEVAESIHLRFEQIWIVLPAFAIEQVDGVLTFACAFIGDATGEAAILEVGVDGTAVFGKMWARNASRFVDGEGIPRVQSQRHATQGCAGATIWG